MILLKDISEEIEMLSQMKKYATNGQMREALIIGQNLFNHDPGNPEIFSAYYSILWSIISSSNEIEEKEQYFQEISFILATFSESVRLDDSMVEYIKAKEDSLNLLFEDIQDLKNSQKRNEIRSRIMSNDDCLKQVESIINQLSLVTKKEEFDILLQKLEECDAKFDKEHFSDRQRKKYGIETQRCSQVVDQKVRYFEREKNVVYNMRALDAYEKVFRYFKENRITDDHKAVIQGLFEFDVSKLFNETLTYYNYVYSYILSKLNDEEKFILTKAAIHSQARK